MNEAETDVSTVREGAPMWLIVAATTSVSTALVVSLVFQRWLVSLAWLAAVAQSIGWLSERASRRGEVSAARRSTRTRSSRVQ